MGQKEHNDKPKHHSRFEFRVDKNYNWLVDTKTGQTFKNDGKLNFWAELIKPNMLVTDPN